MRKALPKGLVRRNLTLPGREAAGLDFLREATEASSDSEVTRQALRHLEQLVEDEELGIELKAKTQAGETLLSSAVFRDRPQDSKDDLIRRSLILHEQSEMRLKELQVRMQATDLSEVVRCALRLYETIVRAAVEGAQFFTKLPSGEEFRVRFGSFAVRPRPTAPAPQHSQPPGHVRPGGYQSELEPVPALRLASK